LKLAEKAGLPPPVEKTNTLAKASSKDPIVGSTNLAQAVSPEVVAGDDQDEEEEKPVPVDPVLTEAEKVMVDYLALLRRSQVVWALKP